MNEWITTKWFENYLIFRQEIAFSFIHTCHYYNAILVLFGFLAFQNA